MVKFKVGDKVKFIEDYCLKWKKGDIVRVSSFWTYGINFIDKKGVEGSAFFKRFELLEPKITKNQRITSLENEVAELKVIVEGLRKSKINVEADAETLENVIDFEGAKYRKVEREAREGDVVIFRKNTSVCVDNNEAYLVELYEGEIAIDDGGNDYYPVYYPLYNRTNETVDVYERIEPSTGDIVVEKSPNELRAEIIEKAKGFMDSNKNREGLYDVKPDGHIIPYSCNVEFIVNEEKRTIVALLRGYQSKKVRSKGIAKCNPSDVFNEHIGKAIALGRALGLDVSEFEGAIQPTEVVEGMVVKNDTRELLATDNYYLWGKTCQLGSQFTKSGQIINDTNAIYREVK